MPPYALTNVWNIAAVGLEVPLGQDTLERLVQVVEPCELLVQRCPSFSLIYWTPATVQVEPAAEPQLAHGSEVVPVIVRVPVLTLLLFVRVSVWALV